MAFFFDMTKKKHGVGAVCRTFMRFIHPSKLIRDKFPNSTHQQKLGELIAIRQEVKTVNRNVMRHNLWPNQELYSVKMWVKVRSEGVNYDFFDTQEVTIPDETITPMLTEEVNGETIPDTVFRMIGANTEDIAMVTTMMSHRQRISQITHQSKIQTSLGARLV